MKIEKVRLLGIDISRISLTETVKAIVYFLKEKRSFPALINNVNVHAYCLSFDNVHFRETINRSEIVFCDGFGVKLAAKILGVRIGERMTPPDWIDELLQECARNNLGVYFLGDEDFVVEQFTKCVKKRHPTLRVSGYHHGFFDKVGEKNEYIVEAINVSDAQLLITGMGMPLQETWAEENQKRLRVNVVLATGALFRWYAKVEKRGPRIFTNNGFEWLWRLCVQPRKVWRRYIVELPYFFTVVIKHWLKKEIP